MKARPETTPAAGDEVRPIPLSAIRSWPGNPRKHFDPKKLEELAASIKSKGVLQPILLRHITPVEEVTDPGGKQTRVIRYEIAAGERRYRAAAIAGLVVIPAVVRRLTDLEMLEIVVVEKLEDLAAKIGKSMRR